MACLFVVVFCGCQTSVVADKKPLPVTDADMLGTWVGLTEDALDYFRIDLQPGGKGLCAYVYVHNEARLLAVDKWSTQAGRIQIAVTPVDDDRNQITKMTGTAHSTVMELTVFGKDWQRRLVMRREEDMEQRANLVRNRMEQHKTASRDASK